METRFGKQPAREALRQERWSIANAAKHLGVAENHLMCTVFGRVRPNEAVREKLPKLLGLPLECLFTADILARPYNPAKNPWKNR